MIQKLLLSIRLTETQQFLRQDMEDQELANAASGEFVQKGKSLRDPKLQVSKQALLWR